MKNISPRIMGILNVTPDSFSDGGRFQAQAQITAHAAQLIEDGADIIDIGGESTRPYAEPVPLEVELERVIPAVRWVRALDQNIHISVDTTKADVAQQAVDAGADMINDVSALILGGEAMLNVVRGYNGSVIIMHSQGSPQTMQDNPCYDDILIEINSFFSQRLASLEEAGIPRERVIIDPGIGFGKILEHNLALLGNIGSFAKHGCPVLIGHSRKSFLANLFDLSPDERDCPSAVVSALCALQGVDILRVHNVHLTRQALTLAQRIGS